jgi:hypothetical protein
MAGDKIFGMGGQLTPFFHQPVDGVIHISFSIKPVNYCFNSFMFWPFSMGFGSQKPVA